MNALPEGESKQEKQETDGLLCHFGASFITLERGIYSGGLHGGWGFRGHETVPLCSSTILDELFRGDRDCLVWA